MSVNDIPIQERRKLWVEALRSGEYTQCTKRLAKPNGYCCLGVACEVFMKNGGELQKATDKYGIYYNGEYLTLPRVVRDWLGLRTENGSIDDGIALSEKNDHGASFEEIANIIEAAPQGLFANE
jgi:hypothetical protein